MTKNIFATAVVLLASPVAVFASDSTCKDVSDLLPYGDPLVAGYYYNNCFTDEPLDQPGRMVRGDTDVQWSAFLTTYLGTLTAAQANGVIKAFNIVFAAHGSRICYSFDPATATGGTFESPASTKKAFCRDPKFSSGNPQVTFGTTGSNGSVTYVVDGEASSFGTLPEATSNYTVKYVTDTMAALLAADANATAANVNTLVTQLFVCATAAKSILTASGGGSGCLIGDATSTNGMFAKIAISPTTGNWSLSSFPTFSYAAVAAP